MSQIKIVRMKNQLISLRKEFIHLKTKLEQEKIEFRVIRGLPDIHGTNEPDQIDYQIELNVGRRNIDGQLSKLKSKIYCVRLSLKSLVDRKESYERQKKRRRSGMSCRHENVKVNHKEDRKLTSSTQKEKINSKFIERDSQAVDTKKLESSTQKEKINSKFIERDSQSVNTKKVESSTQNEKINSEFTKRDSQAVNTSKENTLIKMMKMITIGVNWIRKKVGSLLDNVSRLFALW